MTKQQARSAGTLQVFVDEVADEKLPEYVAATKTLRKANDKAKAAKTIWIGFAEAIQEFASAIDTVIGLAE